MRKNHGRQFFLLPASPRLRVSASPRPRPGFTLIEMLIVMAIIVLAVTLAIPAIRVLTGSRSEQAAQNVVSAYIASARADAIGIQDIEGVLFYIDPGTNRVNCIEVAQSPTPLGTTTDIPGVVYLDLEAGVHSGKSRDPLPLPPGILLMTIKDTVPTTYTTWKDPFASALYMGFNFYPPATANQAGVAPLGGVILFDGNGRLYTGRYGFRFIAAGGATATPLGALVFGNTGVATVPASDWPSATPTLALMGQMAFAMCDRETFLNQRSGNNPFLVNNRGTNGMIGTNPADGQAAGQQSDWLNVNTTPIFINRYNGTLTRAE